MVVEATRLQYSLFARWGALNVGPQVWFLLKRPTESLGITVQKQNAFSQPTERGHLRSR